MNLWYGCLDISKKGDLLALGFNQGNEGQLIKVNEDETYEIKNSEEQSNLIDKFEKNQENEIAEELKTNKTETNEFPTGISIESASYMENKTDAKIQSQISNNENLENNDSEYTPKLFSDEPMQEEKENNSFSESIETKELFDHDLNEEEDFEIPAFLRRQKF